MKYKNVKPTTYMGMDYRSMLETRYGIHFKSLGFDMDYEPEVPGLFGYRPDFVIYPISSPIFLYILTFPSFIFSSIEILILVLFGLPLSSKIIIGLSK